MLLNKIKKILKNPKFRQTIKDIKPKKSLWGFISVVLLFIAPEIVAFIYGDDIHHFCQSKIAQHLPYMESYLYENIDELFSEGSYLNLAIGFAFLIWLFF
jgi:hypothetical protein